MLKLALFFLVVSLVAGIFGFSGISAVSAGMAKVLLFIAILGFTIVVVLCVMLALTLFR
ncbi:DUF1328 domain-containing protein [Novacetimonas maltaceti]|uniref:UPF0391 membrane protein KMAL_09320 n=1 Tax=Novacetimonas maltaceti TaxID=1203393 RepID=A0A2S3W3E0_9PROT|nr:DUF1328 domain-containing protein [Novacetimonas maltaceti]POF63376.1 hypothetical protein KMAL_09320 [Novacetimonas maltaceti]PYD60818.1 DUF1328 domain-containing protein [Novacetimonas maltaceti]